MTTHPDGDLFATGAGLDVLCDIGDQDLEGHQLGDYKISGLIAEGGMSRVYRAQRADGSFEREVAIKVSAVSGISSSLRARFEQEQSVLASLNHPNISQLFDAHVSDDGRPYIIMECIDGRSIVDYCVGNNLSQPERIQLLIDVVDAIAYAHARLVVHRDIKPSNVMVSTEGRVKLLDFGIAKLLEADQALTQATPMTPRYASPEQLLGQPITVASDISQLGLLIYEVVTGQALNASETLADAIKRASDGKPLSIDADAKTRLPRELSLIIEQCLRTDPDERYSDANSLRKDLEAFLQGHPVSAVGQGAGYRFRKLISRNIPTAATIAIALVAIITGVSWYTWQLGIARDQAEANAAEAEIEAEHANQMSQFLIDLFDAPDPQYARGEDVTVKQVLEAGIDKIRTELEGQERVQADLLMTLGRVYNELGEFDKGGPLLDESVEMHRVLGEEDTVAYSLAIYTQAQYIAFRGDLEGAAERFKEALQVARQTPTEKSRERQSHILNSLAIAMSRLNRFEESANYYAEAIAIRYDIYGPDHLQSSVPKANYGRLLTKMGRYEEAVPLLESSYRIAVDELGPYHPWIAPRAINLGRTYQHFGRDAEAEELLRVALDQDRHIYGEEHHYVASSLQNLAVVVYEGRDQAEGIELLEQALEIELASLGPEHLDTNQTRYLLASYYTADGELEAANGLLDDAESVLTNEFDGDHIYLAEVATTRGEYLLAVGQPEAALAKLVESAAMFERLFDADSERLPDVLMPLAEAQLALGEPADAAASYARAVALLEADGKVETVHHARLEELHEIAKESSETGNQSE